MPANVDDGLADAGNAAIDATPEAERTFEWYQERIGTLDVSTAPDKAVFYSGRDPVFGESPLADHEVRSREVGEHYAEATERNTLESTPGGQWLDGEDLYNHPERITKDQANELWGGLSERYAESASGEVVAFSRPDRPDSVWQERELPALEHNPDVTRISQY